MSDRRIFAGLSLILVLFGTSSFAKYSGGTGEPNDPYLIATPEDLNSIGLDPCDWDKHFLMTADINMAGITGDSFNIIGNDVNSFTGVFDGNGHHISHFARDSASSSFVGLFGYIDSSASVIKNLRLMDSNIQGHSYVGALAGLNNGTIINCSTTGSVSGIYGVGGLVGYNDSNGTISYCYAEVSVTGNGGYDEPVGGLVGSNHGTITDCYATGSVSAVDYVGGLAGGTFNGTITNCYATGLVSGVGTFGGLVGFSYQSDISSSFWDLDTTNQANGIGYNNGGTVDIYGKTTTEMRMRDTFAGAGWDMVNVWDIGENQTYPFLRTHLPSDINKDGETNLQDLAILALNWLEQ